MEIHKPKPWHNWREFLKEVGTIVLGVCIALWAEQTVEYFHWRAQVQEARSVIASEMARNLSFAIQRVRKARCEDQQLVDLARMMDAAAQAGSLPALNYTVGVSLRPWSNGAWQSVVASQVATHFSRQQLAAISLAYRRIDRIEAWNRQEIEHVAVIDTLRGAGRRLDGVYDIEVRKAISALIALNTYITVSSARVIQQALSDDLPFTDDDRRQMKDELGYPLSSYCKSNRDQGPSGEYMRLFSSGNLAEMEQATKKLRTFLAVQK